MRDVNTLALMHGVSGCGVLKQVRDDIYFWIVGNGLDARP
jgi:hypothetical protein